MHPLHWAPQFPADANEDTVRQIIPQEILRKYIMYAREKIHPKLHNLDQDKLAQLFADLRRESLSTGSFPITVRHLESMIRMSEASAKMHLREFVRADDIDLAISVTVGSFVNAQKLSIKKTLERVSWPCRLSNTINAGANRLCRRAFVSTLATPGITKRSCRSSSASSSKTRCICISCATTRCPTKSRFWYLISKRGWVHFRCKRPFPG